SSTAGRRGKGASGTPDLLVKAVQPRKRISGDNHDGCVICDLTAGFGQDSLILAMNGAKHVHMVERHPVVFALLEDALRRLDLIATSILPENSTGDAKEQHERAKFLVGKLSLSKADSKEWLSKQRRTDGLNSIGEENIVVYLDPMFPSRQKSAAVKKGMAILHDVLETQTSLNASKAIDLDESKQQEELELLLSALDAADTRVVVKRPVKAPLLGTSQRNETVVPPQPSHSIHGSVSRWDVYVKAAR
ncbi:MAG: hypothetical protein SGILL_008528, partial [Bacillariaceae sp.]